MLQSARAQVMTCAHAEITDIPGKLGLRAALIHVSHQCLQPLLPSAIDGDRLAVAKGRPSKSRARGLERGDGAADICENGVAPNG